MTTHAAVRLWAPPQGVAPNGVPERIESGALFSEHVSESGRLFWRIDKPGASAPAWFELRPLPAEEAIYDRRLES